jgi:hypothetical protein
VKKIFFCLLFLNFQLLSAQSLTWFEGSVVLSTCEVLVGKISIKEDHDLILFEQGETRMVYPSHRIKSLYFYDRENNINRRYLSLKEKDGVRSSYHLYEIVIAGRVDVLRRKKTSAFSEHTSALDFNYFIRYNEELIVLRKFKRKVFPQLRSESDTRLENFITANKLRADLPTNAIRIIEYYNSLVKVEDPVAIQNSKFKI